jgi:integrase
MIKGLREILDDFSGEIRKSIPDYLSLYNYFYEYIDEKYKDEESSLEDFLTNNFCRRDIINSCVHYTEKSNASSVTAIEKYLNSMTKLYNSCIKEKGYDNKNLSAIAPFASLKSEVKEKISNKKLAEKDIFPAINEDEFVMILNYINSIKKKSFVKAQIIIIFKLMLLFGFKLEKIKYIQINDYNSRHNTLRISIDDSDNNKFISLELPNSLSDEIREYIHDFRNDVNEESEQYLFLNREKKVITPSYLSYVFTAIKEENKIENDRKSFTSTGLAKYAIKNMIKSGIGSADIKLITGMEDVVIDACEMEVREDNTKDIGKLNRIINSKIRGIETYDYLSTF